MKNEVVHFQLNQFDDDRGSFKKKFSSVLFPEYQIRQINQVKSPKGVFRGLHYQKGQSAEAKIFTVNHGEIQLVYFDLHTKEGNAITIKSDNSAVLVPRGFATGYLVLSEMAEVLYYSDNDYNPDAEAGLRWNDGRLASINWEADIEYISDKDGNWSDIL